MDKALRILFVLVLGSLTSISVSLSNAQSSGKTILRVRGANTMATMIDKLAKTYDEIHTDCSVAVSGGGIQEGLRALQDKTVDVVMATRQISTKESQSVSQKGIRLTERLIGWEAIPIIVHPDNPVKELTVEQLRKVFAGDCTDWNDLGGETLQIVLYVGDPSRSGMAEFINESVLKTVPPYANLRRYYPSIIKDVSSRADAAGYVPLALALKAQSHGTIKILGIKKDSASPAIWPSPETVADRTYPLTRPLFLCYDEKSTKNQIKQFVEFCASKGLGLQ